MKHSTQLETLLASLRANDFDYRLSRRWDSIEISRGSSFWTKMKFDSNAETFTFSLNPKHEVTVGSPEEALEYLTETARLHESVAREQARIDGHFACE
jgi:hypothetical protein